MGGYKLGFWIITLLLFAGFAHAADAPYGIVTGEAESAPVWRTHGPPGDIETAEGKLHAVGQVLYSKEGRIEGAVTHVAPDGTKYRIYRVESPGAQGIQAHFAHFALPEHVQVFVYNLPADPEDQQVLGPFTGAGPTGFAEFWTPALPGSALAIEMQWTGDEPSTLPFRVNEVGHKTRKPDHKPAKLQAPEKKGTMKYRGQDVAYVVSDGRIIIDGCIDVGSAEDLESGNLVGGATGIVPLQKPAGGWFSRLIARMRGPNAAGKATAVSSSTQLWTRGVIAYEIDQALPNPQRVTDAMAHWTQMTNGSITFVPRTNEQAYVRFVRPASAGTCSSSVGKTGYGQTVNLGDYCSTGNAIHEIGHAVGFWHEQSRTDRDRYVRILTENIQSTATYNFNIQTNSRAVGNYDYGSIMHYGAYAFSANGLPTIETIPAGISIGQRSGLSAGDVSGTLTLYGITKAPAAPIISLKPATLASTGIAGADTTLTQQLTVVNSGPAGTTLNWTATPSQAWILIEPRSGPLASGQSTTATVTMNAAGMGAGTYTGSIDVSAPGAENTPQRVPVTMTLVIDTPPSVSFITPANGTGVSGNVALSADAYSALGIAGVAFAADGQSLGEDTVAPYGLTWSTAGLSGQHTLSATARDQNGKTSTTSIWVSVIPPTTDTTPPSQVTALRASATSNAVSLSWTAAVDNVGVVGYRVYRNGALKGAVSATTYKDTAVQQGANYTYAVEAYDAAGNVGTQATASALIPRRGKK